MAVSIAEVRLQVVRMRMVMGSERWGLNEGQGNGGGDAGNDDLNTQ